MMAQGQKHCNAYTLESSFPLFMLIIWAKCQKVVRAVFSFLATIEGIVKESRRKILLCSLFCTCQLPELFPSKAGNIMSAWPLHWVRQKMSWCSFSGNLFGAEWTSWAKTCLEICFSCLEKMNPAASSQMLHLEAGTISIEWYAVCVGIFRPSVYFWILVPGNRLGAPTDAAGCQVVLCNGTRLWWVLHKP